MEQNLFQIRVTGILVENNAILLVKQRVSPEREWSLPGGRVEHGETLEQAIVREMLEETGLETRVVKLLYLCDNIHVPQPNLHITFLLERVGGLLRLPTNEFDHNPIADVRFIPVEQLTTYHFSSKFQELIMNNFPQSGSYQGPKAAIGL